MERPAFTFATTTHPQAEQQEMLDHYAKPSGYQTELRQPTALEWIIIEAILDGTLIARLFPQFLRRVCDGENLLPFQRTIVAQVEGELAAQLLDRSPMYPDYQTSDRIVEAMLTATRTRGGEQDQVYPVLREIKAAAYNRATHSIHLVFYNRATAANWSEAGVPFRQQVLASSHIHGHKREQAGRACRSASLVSTEFKTPI